jgi:uncharacterized protein
VVFATRENNVPIAIEIIIAGQSVSAELNDTDTALDIADALPIETDFSTWGDEIYFPIPVQAGLEDGQEVVELGDLGYWPPGNAFCIFYGATPGSTEDAIRPASPVNVVGTVLGDPKVFKVLAEDDSVILIQKA